MDLNFVKINPVMNMTVFVTDKIPEQYYAKVADKIMGYDSLYAEQVGFIENPIHEDCDSHLHMMGGEFCGNATRSLAAYVVYKNPDKYPLDEGKTYTLKIEAYGEKKPLLCHVRPTQIEKKFYSDIQMPLPLTKMEVVEKIGKIEDVKKIDLGGITHFSVDKKAFGSLAEKEDFFAQVKSYMKKNHSDYKAFGIMFYDQEKDFMYPLVYVRSTDSLFWEKSCASGSSAMACMMAYQAKSSIQKDIHQPGGHLTVSVDYQADEIKKVVLGGDVEMVAEGRVNVFLKK